MNLVPTTVPVLTTSDVLVVAGAPAGIATEREEVGQAFGIVQFLQRTGPANLIVAGRSESATHVAMSPVRVEPTCIALSQAAGNTGAVALKHQKPLCDVPAADLRAALTVQGV